LVEYCSSDIEKELATIPNLFPKLVFDIESMEKKMTRVVCLVLQTKNQLMKVPESLQCETRTIKIPIRVALVINAHWFNANTYFFEVFTLFNDPVAQIAENSSLLMKPEKNRCESLFVDFMSQ
jgi:hypothetical protein